MVLGVPRGTQANGPKGDGEPLVVVWPERGEDDSRDRREQDEAVPRRPQLKKEGLEEFGYTQGCPACKTALLRKPAQGHSDVCRKKEWTFMILHGKNGKSCFVDGKNENL